MTSNKKLLLLIVFKFISTIGLACNSCSQVSVVGDNGLLLQNVLNDYFSLQTRIVSFASHGQENEKSNDKLIASELMMKKGLSPKIYAWAAIPYQNNYRQFDALPALKNHGLGDVRLGVDYSFNEINLAESFQVRPILTVGIKAPTGHYEHYIMSQGMPRSFNAGTGSWGAIFNASIMWRYKKLGGVLGGTYFSQGRNKYGYMYGCQQNVSASLFYTILEKNAFRIVPTAGIAWDNVQADANSGVYLKESTGGNSLLYQMGSNISYKNNLFSVSINLPLSQHYAGGSVQLNNLLSMRYTYILNK